MELSIYGPNQQHFYFTWHSDSTTIKDLLWSIMDHFNLHKIERERIHIFTWFEELDLFCHPDRLLVNTKIGTSRRLHIEIIPPLSPTSVRALFDEVTIFYFGFIPLISDSSKISVQKTVGDLSRLIQRRLTIKNMNEIQIIHDKNVIQQNDSETRLIDLGVTGAFPMFVENRQRRINQCENTSPVINVLPILNTSMTASSRQPKPVGLSNIGNTCFMNSALQCLAHVKQLTDFFLNHLNEGNFQLKQNQIQEWNPFYNIGPVTGAYADLLKNLWALDANDRYDSSWSWRSYQPTQLKEIIGIRAPRFATWDQQDAHEFMTFLLDEMDKELKDNSSSNSVTIISELFFGMIQSTITCCSCQHQQVNRNLISLVSLHLQLSSKTFLVRFIDRRGDHQSLQLTLPINARVKNLVNHFLKQYESRMYRYCGEILVLNGDISRHYETPLTELSTGEVTLVEQDQLSTRFYDDMTYQDQNALTLDQCFASFCSIESLEDESYCQNGCQQRTRMTKQLIFESLPKILIIQLKRFSVESGLKQKLNTLITYPIDGFDLTPFLFTTSNSCYERQIYNLFAVVNHIGSIYGGHYNAYARRDTKDGDRWYKFDDSFVTEIYSKDHLISRDAYLLFYRKKEIVSNT